MRIFSKQHQCPQDSIVHSYLQAPSQSAWILSASIVQKQNPALKAMRGKANWFRVRYCPSTESLVFSMPPPYTAQGTLPHVIGGNLSEVSAFYQTSSKEGNQHEKDSLSYTQAGENKGCLFLVATILLFQRNEDIPRTTPVPVSCTEIRCSSVSLPFIPPPEFPQSKTLILFG